MVGLALEKQVDFHDIEILEFNYRLGDNPSVTAGAQSLWEMNSFGNQKSWWTTTNCKGERERAAKSW